MFNFLSEKFSSIFARITGNSQLTPANINDALEKVKDSLVEADVPQAVVETFIESVRTEALGQKALAAIKPNEQFIKIVYEKLQQFLGGQNTAQFSFQMPAVVMVMGLQGSGKTTTIAKMVHFVNKQAMARGKQRRILVASVDFYRPAAVEQLEILSKTVGATFYRSPSTDPVQAAEDILRYYQKEHFELLFLDTAGRLHVEGALIEELRQIDAKLKPRYKFLVLDGMTGQESLAVAQAFDHGVGFNSAILTKMDSEVRGGVAFAFRYVMKKPILFAGTGEKPQDFEQFYPERMAKRILGMGDLETLLERAQESLQDIEQESKHSSMANGKFSLQDFADQLKLMGKMGNLSQIARYLPGFGGQVKATDLEQGERELKKFQAIINSMTPKERLVHKLLDNSRKKRVALGAGVTVTDVNLLLDRFEQTQQFVKLFKKTGRFPNMFR
jgi:signal recognition particle subunit SRP54